MQLAHKLTLSAEDYLAGELHSEIRHEYIDGEVYAMAGAGENHNLIALNVAAHLRQAVRGSPCRVFIADMKVRIAVWNSFYYPDIVVTCEPGDAQTYYKEQPRLIVEVLSPSTEQIDRREKLHAYRTISNLQEYVLISQHEQLAEVFRREADGRWSVRISQKNGILRFASLDVDMTMDAVYEDVRIEAATVSLGIR